MSKTGYVYTLNDPRTGEPKYVGATKDPHQRLESHQRDPTNHDIQDWLNELRESGESPLLTIIRVVPREELSTTEKELIIDLNEEWDLLNKKHISGLEESEQIRVSETNWKRLNALKDPGDSFDDVVGQLLEVADDA